MKALLHLAAVSVATPVFLFFMAAGNIFGIGGSSFLSRALGEKKYETAKNIGSFCLYAGIFTGLIGAVLMFTFMRQILEAVGTSSNTFGFAKSYLFPNIFMSAAVFDAFAVDCRDCASQVNFFLDTVTHDDSFFEGQVVF